MEEIARTAGVGKDTLYRRWPSKEPLAIEVVDALAREAVRPAPVDPDPRLNLLLYLKDVVRLNERSDFGALIAGLASEAARNPELATRFTAFWQRRRAIAAELVRDVVGPQVGSDELERLLDRVLAPIYYRLLITRAPITDEFLWGLVTEIPPTTEPTRNAWNSELESTQVPAGPGSAPAQTG